MKRTRLGLALLVSCCWLWQTAAARAEEQMVHIVFRISAPEIPQASPARAPREVWRVGTHYARMQESPDPQQGIHALIISNAPDIWMINLYQRTGQHIVDRGPSTDVHIPILPGASPDVLQSLEFGDEIAFFDAHGARTVDTAIIGGIETGAKVLTFGETTVTLYTRADGHPLELTMDEADGTFTVHYDTYEAGLAPDWSLFKPPANLKIVEAQH